MLLFHAQLASDKIQRLNPVGAFINGRDFHISQELFHRILAAEAVTAVALHGRFGNLEADIGAVGLDDGRKDFGNAEPFVFLRFVPGHFLPVETVSGKVNETAHGVDRGLHGQQHSADVRVLDDGDTGALGFLNSMRDDP